MNTEADIEFAEECAEKLERLISFSPDGPISRVCVAYMQHAKDQIEGELAAARTMPRAER